MLAAVSKIKAETSEIATAYARDAFLQRKVWTTQTGFPEEKDGSPGKWKSLPQEENSP